MTQNIKVYANEQIFVTKEKVLIEKYNSFMSSAPMFGDMPEFKQEYIAFFNEIREKLQIANVISLQYVEKDAVLLIFTFDIFANAGLTYKQGFDEKGVYMLLDAKVHP